jgi:formate dehydrogenase major subunit
MKITRRSFLKISGLGTLGICTAPKRPSAKVQNGSAQTKTGQTTSVCPFCAVGCGLLVSRKNGRVTDICGDPDHPINQGALCAKGQALPQMVNNPRRLDKVLYRPPGGTSFEEKSWPWAMARIAARIKQTRDAGFVRKEGDTIVNRTDAIACLGGAALDNEECYLYVKLARALGITRIEHQARI